ncbi:MAG: RodZ domain-containing protein [Pseudomonadota bacterium]
MTADNKSQQPADDAVSNPTPETTAEQQQQPVKGAGELLKEAREQKGLSQREVADRLRLREQIIDLLEADDYESFSTPTFVKGYLRSYAKLLEIDEQPIFAAYRASGNKDPDTSVMQSFSRRVKHQESDNRLMLITYAVIIVVIGLVIWWWQDSDFSFDKLGNETPDMQQQAPARQTSDSETTASVERTPVDSSEQVLESDVGAADVSTSMSDNPAQLQTDDGAVTVTDTETPDTVLEQVNEPAPEAESQPQPETGEVNTTERPAMTDEEPITVTGTENSASELAEVNQPAPAVEADLVFQFSEECWVKIDDVEGETQAVGVKDAGYTMSVPGEAPFSVTICRPEAVKITYQGSELDLSNLRRARVARFTIPLTN